MTEITTSNLCDAIVASAAKTPAIMQVVTIFPVQYPMFSSKPMQGPIAYCPYAGDRATMIKQIKTAAQKGGVLVIENYARADCAAVDPTYFRDIDLSRVRGIIVNGAIRGSAHFRTGRLPFRARGIQPMPYTPLASEHLEPARTRRFAWAPDAFVVGDEDGLVVMQSELILQRLGFAD
jgi:regulator of RNase E activity RraA